MKNSSTSSSCIHRRRITCRLLILKLKKHQDIIVVEVGGVVSVVVHPVIEKGLQTQGWNGTNLTTLAAPLLRGPPDQITGHTMVLLQFHESSLKCKRKRQLQLGTLSGFGINCWEVNDLIVQVMESQVIERFTHTTHIFIHIENDCRRIHTFRVRRKEKRNNEWYITNVKRREWDRVKWSVS